jgi:hypothetical protein
LRGRDGDGRRESILAVGHAGFVRAGRTRNVLIGCFSDGERADASHWVIAFDARAENPPEVTGGDAREAVIDSA